jgi:hypothetical protein
MKIAMCSAAALSILVIQLQAVQQPTTPAHSTRLLTGCLQAGSASETYRLTGATSRGDAVEVAGQPIGTSGQKMEYDLAANTGLDRSGPPIDLKAHVGHQVEVTVRPAEIVPAAPVNAGGAQASAAAKPEERKPARVLVTAIKMLAASCS